MASAKIIAGTRVNSDNMVGIYIQVLHNRQKINLPIAGLKISEGNFDENKFIKKCEKNILNISLTNSVLKDHENKAMKVINSLATSNTLVSMSIQDLCNFISLACFNTTTTNKTLTFGSYTDKLVEELKEAKRFGNASVYGKAKDFIVNKVGRDITLNELNLQLLNKIETTYYASGKSVNGLSQYMRTIRAIYNRAIADKLVSRESYPFNEYKIKSEKTKKRALPLEEFKKIKNMKFDPKKNRASFNSHNYFMLSFYARGMNFMDMGLLKVGNIVAGRIEYRRAKTGELFNIQVTRQIQDILDCYITPTKKPTDFVFPIVKRESEEEQYADIVSQRRWYDKCLKTIAKEAKVQAGINISGYVARHSWATIAKRSGVSVELISEGLGHADLRTTQIYLDSFESGVMDTTGQVIADLLDN